MKSETHVKTSETSGNTFSPTPRHASKRPLLIGLVAIVLCVGVFGYSLSNKMNSGKAKATSEDKEVTPAQATALFAQGDEAGIIEAESTPLILDDTPEDTLIVPESLSNSQNGYGYSGATQKSEAQQRREILSLAAKEADTTVYVSNPANVTIGSATTSHTSDSSPLLAELKTLYQRKAEAENHLTSLNGKDSSTTPTQFGTKNDSTYLPHRRTEPASKYVIRQGTVIPSVMVSGINSELPGQILAQVRENVYDTATGRYLLIPQGARLSGSYENQLISGQNRVYVVWNRLIFHDGSALTLEGMPGTDQAGYGGFQDKTNHHLLKTYGQALLLSAFSAGVQLSQPRPEPGETTVSAQQIGAAALGQQLGQLGMEQARQNLRQAPTIEIRPGYPFNVMVNQDVILKPWKANQTS